MIDDLIRRYIDHLDAADLGFNIVFLHIVNTFDVNFERNIVGSGFIAFGQGLFVQIVIARSYVKCSYLISRGEVVVVISFSCRYALIVELDRVFILVKDLKLSSRKSVAV